MQPKTDWELSVGWDHPMVKAGFWPGHLLRQTFGYAETGWKQWCKEHPQLIKRINQRPWFHLDTFLAWAAAPENADDLPEMG